MCNIFVQQHALHRARWEPAATAVYLLLFPCCAQLKVLAPQELVIAQEKGVPVIDVRPVAEYEKASVGCSNHNNNN